MAQPRHPPSLARYETARRLMSDVAGADCAALELCLTLWRFSDELTASFEAFYAGHGLSSARGHVLAQLLDSVEGYTPAELAERAGTTPATMTGLLKSLEAERLIRRHGLRDRRSHRVVLTARGRARFHAILPHLAARLQHIAGSLAPDERVQLMRTCGRLSELARSFWSGPDAAVPDHGRPVTPRRPSGRAARTGAPSRRTVRGRRP